MHKCSTIHIRSLHFSISTVLSCKTKLLLLSFFKWNATWWDILIFLILQKHLTNQMHFLPWVSKNFLGPTFISEMTCWGDLFIVKYLMYMHSITCSKLLWINTRIRLLKMCMSCMFYEVIKSEGVSWIESRCRRREVFSSFMQEIVVFSQIPHSCGVRGYKDTSTDRIGMSGKRGQSCIWARGMRGCLCPGHV